MSKLLVKLWLMITMLVTLFIALVLYNYEAHGLEEAADFVFMIGFAGIAYWRGYKLGVSRNE